MNYRIEKLTEERQKYMSLLLESKQEIKSLTDYNNREKSIGEMKEAYWEINDLL